MNFSFAEIINSMQNYWKKLTRSQQTVLVLAPLIVGTALFVLVFWASRPQYVVLFNKLSASEAGAITAKLSDLAVSYQLSDSGSTILVPNKDASEVRLQLANAGLPQESTFSFENLDQMRIGDTDKDRRLRYILGLQNELEKTIEILDGVEYARVHIVMPEQSLFMEENNESTASVTLKTTYGVQLGEDQVRSIANLLAYSVEGLKIDNVSIADTNGHVLSDIIGKSSEPHRLTTNQIQVQQSLEDNIQRSVQSMLDKVFGTGKTIVRINATLDFDQKKITSHISEDGAILSRQETQERSQNMNGTEGVPGEDPNVPEEDTPGYMLDNAGNSSSVSESSSLTENFQPSLIQEETIISPGQIKRMTVSVMADSDSVTEEQLVNIESIISSSVGVDEARGDLIQVARLPFNKTSMLEERAAMENAARTQQLIFYAQIAGGIIGSLFLIIMVFRLRSRRVAGFDQFEAQTGNKPVTIHEAEQILASQIDAERQAELKLALRKTKSPEAIEKEKTRKEVEKYSRENPDETARLVRTWLAEER
ncbi:MAG: flagellar M-ring protein FliF [Gracilibacter sp. BRH_c7a]|nr:MAG: flagellar M-ring protein FliF [Gracilibacter sp. BRH_c7a]